MFRLSSRVQKVLSQILGFAFVVSSTLFANWLWQKYTNGIDQAQHRQEEREDFLKIARKVIEETEYNCTDGIGDAKCPFLLDSHNQLLGLDLRDYLSKPGIELVRDILRLGGLCNGGRTNKKINASMVKNKSLELKALLQNVLAAELAKENVKV